MVFYYISDPISCSTSVELTYHTEASELDNTKAKFKKALKKALDSAPKNATDYELELYANNYLVDNCVYDEEAVKSEEIIGHENDAYGALVEKKAVCEGYSRAFQLLCNRLGVECINISGTAVLSLNGFFWRIRFSDSDMLNRKKDAITRKPVIPVSISRER